MQQLTSPHVRRLMGAACRRREVDQSLLSRTRNLIGHALRDGEALTRAEITSLLGRNGIEADGPRMALIMMDAELECLVCSGPAKGKQQTYMLLELRAPAGQSLSGDEALAELTRRFFLGHGPATDREYARWSGFNLTTARRGIALVEESLAAVDIDGCRHWLDPDQPWDVAIPEAAYLLSEFDECWLTYPTVNFPDLPAGRPGHAWTDRFYRPVIVGGRRAGTWRRTAGRKRVLVEADLFAAPTPHQIELIAREVERLGRFLELPAEIAPAT
jgi:hypothetical protein